ncbi:MAG: hypothetical protein A3F84_04380 [Candidatus Handelsmanbacteria bacterium RIFCSPLOWO2_12_FULL_64_10]|uniref:UspA domain-containing protein n=1 Tax=Handelsmanbacteria sp. (strain RIFCSPLOWO2_12_FULL_64_10) TaxID=1817868 RepID=A0A1F6D2X9_HANXR|nr:MAG: hypothetical protein A3F84_04380 [Candidatus Handelsmanbacteria bacterium RIFCSPLOWO2_12_FULL_64_10]
MGHRILVPLDGTRLARSVLPWADLFAQALYAETELMRVVEPLGEVSASMGRLADHEILERATEDALASLRADQSEIHGRAASIHVMRGEVSETIADRANALQVSLIIMASHSRAEPARTIIGSNVASVIHRSKVPVLVIRPNLPRPATMPTHVLLAQDGSELAAAVLPEIVPLAQQLGWTLVLFRAVELPPPRLAFQGGSIPLGHVPDDAPVAALDNLEQLSEEAGKSGVRTEIRFGSGDPATAICEAAREAGCGLIALGTHGREGLPRLVLGSVTEGVIQAASVPVLTFRPESDVFTLV